MLLAVTVFRAPRQVVNIYDLDSRTYEFKLALPLDVSTAAAAVVSASTSLGVEPMAGAGVVSGEAGTSEPATAKLNLIMESGVRFHASRFTRPHASDAGNLPSGFTMTLRKHVRSRRLSGTVVGGCIPLGHTVPSTFW